MNELDSEIDDIHNQIEKLMSKWEDLAEYDWEKNVF
jgi:peptidoglycan hydrolase CwlO-like protein